MDKQQALAIIKQVCSAYKGTLEEHTTIQSAIEELNKEKPKK